MSREIGRRIASLSDLDRARAVAATKSPSAKDPRKDTPAADPSALSFGEERMWFLHRLEPGAHTYHLHSAVRLEGDLQLDLLGRAIETVAERQESLRTTYSEVDGRPRRTIFDTVPFRTELHDLSGTGPGALEARLTEQAQNPFDLERGPLVRAGLFRLSERECVISVTIHHIISDGWSLRVFFAEAFTIYGALAAGRRDPAPPLSLRYCDYAARQRQELERSGHGETADYWRRRLTDTPVLNLPGDRSRPAVQSYRGARVETAVSRSRLRKLIELGRSENATLFMTLLAAFHVLLYRHSGQADFAVGSPISNRETPGAEAVIGFFGNTLALRSDLRGAESFREALRRVRRTVLDGFAHKDYPFERIVHELSPKRSRAYNPIFQAMLVLNEPWSSPPPGPLKATPLPASVEVALCDLTLSLVETDLGLAGFLEYSADLFDHESAERIARRFETLIGSLIEAPDSPLEELEILPSEERRKLLVDWNQTARSYPERLLHELVEEQAARTPDAQAVQARDRSLTYAELQARSEQAAERLRRRGFGRGDLAGIGLGRTTEAVVWMLAVLKAGGAYVPLDPAYPAERTTFMLRDSGARIVVVSRESALGTVPAETERVVVEEVEAPETEFPPPTRPSVRDLAYVIYTSGSTGRPKGVAIEHRSASTLIQWALETYSRDELAVVAATTSFCFDLSVFELFVPLAAGGTVLLTDDLPSLAATPGADSVTLINSVPSVLAASLRVAPIPPSVRVVNLAGERLTQDLVRRIYLGSSVDRVVDLYGPSEDTTYSTFAERRPAGVETIGRPIANTRAYILDSRLRPVPVGAPGELCLAGDGLARGYLGRPELTTERFVPDPFDAMPGARLYRTGDLARHRSDGSIEYLGRSDHQVKVRGFRVELGEIEAVLRRRPGVAEAVVVARPAPDGAKTLAAFVEPEPGPAPDADRLRSSLAGELPDFMVPSRIEVADAFPRSANGKIDRKALETAASAAPPSTGYVAPRNDTEAQLAAVWAELLDLDRVGVRDDFFELGGHSLLAIQVFARIAQTTGRELPLSTLFDHSTVEALARQIDERTEQPDEPQERTALIPIQAEGDLPPLFCLHADSGLALFYRDLARRLGNEQPVWAFQSIGLDGQEPPLESVEEMAERYLGEMRTVQPRGPYYLAGFCMGSYIAQEMARRLETEGESVAFLGSFNTDGEWRMAGAVGGELGFHRENLARISAPKKIVYLLERVVYRLSRIVFASAITLRGGWEKISGRPPVVLRHLHLEEINRKANRDFQARPYSGRVVFFQGDQDAYRDPMPFWGRVARGGVEVVPVEGREITVLQEPNVGRLAEQLREKLRLARDQRRPTDA